MNAGFGARFLPEDFRRLLRPPPLFLAELFLPRLDDLRDEDLRDEDFLPPFLLVAILSPGLVIRMDLLQGETRPVSDANYSPAGRKQ
jgi:hypothetical protein